ncbi:uncharacterized protein LOC100373183 [Saccoglossus kowalevskii]|uniref:U5 small nuclear ribonucleoprotein TSSC4 n=1 Tax=Saccoglossus kowalevskii TaxID=10224 RepID=A0ABM0GWW6_SACKO|nr:PREDICTED: protein TSSC4-like isoform X1 [Saccoglossus kowalevskii]XP_006822014.1 PREDICTED: protein TSSC4-like isoform X2 [Saccoglossus kowalevskii]
MEDSGNRFKLKSDEDGFEDRNKDVFGGLTSLEDHYLVDARKRSSCYDDDVDEGERSHCKRSRREFKRPDIPNVDRLRGRGRGGRRKTPDYVLHPYSWTKYSLRETGEEHMSEKGDSLNKKVALEFLQKNKTPSEDKEEMTEEDNDRKMVFKKPIKKKEVQEKTKPKTSASLFVDNTHKIKLRYVVGKEKRENKKNISTVNTDNSQTSSCLDLHHLDDDVSQSEDSKSDDTVQGYFII